MSDVRVEPCDLPEPEKPDRFTLRREENNDPVVCDFCERFVPTRNVASSTYQAEFLPCDRFLCQMCIQFYHANGGYETEQLLKDIIIVVRETVREELMRTKHPR